MVAFEVFLLLCMFVYIGRRPKLLYKNYCRKLLANLYNLSSQGRIYGGARDAEAPPFKFS